MYLSLFQLIGIATFLILIGGIIGYCLQLKKIKSLKNELKIKNASLKGMWSTQEKKNREKLISKHTSNLDKGINPVHISDSYPSATR